MASQADYIFSAWAPHGGRWSAWVKPVLFAHMTVPPPPDDISPLPICDLSWLSPANNAALVIDLPGALGVSAALAAAERGYLPVPLYNAAPAPSPMIGSFVTPREMIAVDALSIMVALYRGAENIRRVHLPLDAPPAFLLDSNRRTSQSPIEAGMFDNRSVSFPTDFPSANLLLHHGISRAILITSEIAIPATDLSHTLLRWQKAGIAILSKAMSSPGMPALVKVRKPWWFGSMWYRVSTMLRLKRHALGGYGGMLPEAGSGGGFGSSG